MGQTLRFIYAITFGLLAHLLLPFYILESFFKCLFGGRLESIDKKVVVVTGAGNGLGKEIALQLVTKHKCRVVCVDMKKMDLDESVKFINSHGKTNDMACGFVCDITDAKKVTELRDFVVEKYGHVDMVINNAAFLYVSTFSEGVERHMSRCIDVNLMGTIWVTKAFLTQMKKQSYGRIVFVNSFGGLVADHGVTMYSTSKSALAAFSLNLHKELRTNSKYDGISVSSAFPWFLDSCPDYRQFYKANAPTLPLPYTAHSIIDGARRKVLEFTVPFGSFGVCLTLLISRILPDKFNRLIQKIIDVQWARTPSDMLQAVDSFMAPNTRHKEMCEMYNEGKVKAFFERVVD